MNSYLNNKRSPNLSPWGGSGGFSSHWTLGLSGYWFFFSLVAFLVFHWVISTRIPPTEDELYYWTWAQHLQKSYYDHPPMVAYLIKVSTSIFGDNLFGIRFFASLIHFLIFLLIGTLVPGKKILSLVLLTPLAFFGAVLMTPDVPFLLFWTLYLFWLVSLSKSFSQWGDDPVSRVYRSSPIFWETWVLGGVLLGLGLLSKYTMVLAIPCSFLVLLTKYRFKSWFKGFCSHLVIALIVATPILIFNSKYQFSPLKFQWNHGLSDGSGVFGEFLGGQVLLLGALPLLMLGWVLIRKNELCTNPVLRVCFYCFVFPFLFSLFQAAKTHVEANWALMSYIAFWPLAQALLNQNSIQILEYLFLGLGFIPPILVSVLIGIHLVHPLKFVAPEKDRLGKYRAIYEVAQSVKSDLVLNGKDGVLFLPTYQLTSYFRFLGLASEQLFPLGRASNFTLEPKDPCQLNSILVLSETPEPNYELLKCFPEKQLLKEYSLEVRKKEISQLYLIEYFRAL